MGIVVRSGSRPRTRTRGSPCSARNSRYAGVLRRARSNAIHARHLPKRHRIPSKPGTKSRRYVFSERVSTRRNAPASPSSAKTRRRRRSSDKELLRLEAMAARRLGAVAEPDGEPERPRLGFGPEVEQVVRARVRIRVRDDRAERMELDAVLRQRQPEPLQQPARREPVVRLLKRSLQPRDRRRSAHRATVEAADGVADARQLGQPVRAEEELQQWPGEAERGRGAPAGPGAPAILHPPGGPTIVTLGFQFSAPVARAFAPPAAPPRRAVL